MSLVAQLVGFGLRQVIGDFADNAVQVVEVVEQRFRDHSRTLPKALNQAHRRAWDALSIALAGDTFADRIRVFFASGDDKGVREQVQIFLNSNAVSFDGASADFRRDCLDELKRLRKSGLLAVPGGSPAEIARQAAGFRRHADPQGLIEESRRAVAGVADALAEGYPNLARLLRTPTPAGPPLLAAAFCYFFRREVETDDELAHGLFFDGLRQLSASQAKAFGEVGKALAALGGQFDALFEQLGRIEAAVVETQAVAVETHGAVLDVQAELQRLGGLHLANAGEVRTLLEQVLLQLAQADMARGEVRPGNSCSIRGEDERRAVKSLLETGREKGYLTYDQVSDLLPEDDAAASKKIDQILILLEKQGIEMIEESEIERRREQREAAHQAKLVRTPERDIDISVPGTWYIRAPNGEAVWLAVANTPGKVRIAPGKSYKFAVRGVGEKGLFGLARLCGLNQPEVMELTSCAFAADQGLASLGELTQLRALHFRKCQGVTDEGLRTLAALKTLRTLQFGECGWMSVGLKALAALTGLQELSFWLTHVWGAGLKELAPLQGLRKLELRGCKGVKDADLKCVSALRELQTLDLCGTEVTDSGLKELAALKAIQKLDLGGTKVTDAGLKELAALPALHTLYLCGGITDAGVKALVALKGLQKLALCGCPNVAGTGLQELAALKGLQTLYLGSSGVTDAGLTQLAALEGLRTLDLSNTSVTDAGLRELATLKELQTLGLLGCKGVTGSGLNALAGLDELRILDLRGTGFTDGRLTVLAALKGLQKLNLGCNELAGAGLKELAVLKGLHTLELRDTGITDAGLKEIGTLRGLRQLSLWRTKVTGAGLKELVALQELQTLELLGCKGEIGVRLKALAALQALETLDLRDTKVTDAGLKELVALKTLRTLRLRSTKITDAGLKALTALEGLRSLSLIGMKFSDGSIAALQNALPNCYIDTGR